MKKALVIRCGALGDMIILSPVFRALKEQGYRTYVYTGKRGITILENNPFVDEVIEYEKEGEENPNIAEDWQDVIDRVKPDWVKNFSESIEVNLALHPMSPKYIYPKKDRRQLCDKNYYDETEKWAGIKLWVEGRKHLPEVYFSGEEMVTAKSKLKSGFNVLWCLSGSGANKAYPWADYVMGEILKEYPDVNFLTIGDERCQIIETLKDDRIINLSGEVNFRISMALTRVVDLVVSPDTGVLHAAGSSDVPKIGILGHTTIENITKHFINDYSLEADEKQSECAPCFRLIYDHKIQCPIDNLSGAAWCMGNGHDPKRLSNQIRKVINDHGTKKEEGCLHQQGDVSCVQSSDAVCNKCS